jgi:hypothetical protein
VDELLTVSGIELSKIEIMQLLKAKRLKQREATELLGVRDHCRAAVEMASRFRRAVKKGRSLSGKWETNGYRISFSTAGTRKCAAETGQRNPKKSDGNVLEGRQMKYRFIEIYLTKYLVQPQLMVDNSSYRRIW